MLLDRVRFRVADILLRDAMTHHRRYHAKYALFLLTWAVLTPQGQSSERNLPGTIVP